VLDHHVDEFDLRRRCSSGAQEIAERLAPLSASAWSPDVIAKIAAAAWRLNKV
jgi:hypothetical protein